jgi:hypothetical protein
MATLHGQSLIFRFRSPCRESPMFERFDFYDLLGVAIPGVLFAYWVAVCFPAVTGALAGADLPEAVDVIGFAAVAITIGYLLQAIASDIEGILHRTWGGKPSERALSEGLGDRYLSAGAASRIRDVLVTVSGEGASNQDLFQMALTHSNATPASRSERFNALYAYHRSLLVVVVLALLLMVASRFWGAAAAWSDGAFRGAAVAQMLTFALLWHRTQQRANHFVRETLYVAERTLQPRDAAPTLAKEV